jgi:hypothetical protein
MIEEVAPAAGVTGKAPDQSRALENAITWLPSRWPAWRRRRRLAGRCPQRLLVGTRPDDVSTHRVMGFDPPLEAVLRFAAELVRVRRSVRGWLDKRASAVRRAGVAQIAAKSRRAPRQLTGPETLRS